VRDLWNSVVGKSLP